nr:hypothetical protein [Tanacetum cinerariifolium]
KRAENSKKKTSTANIFAFDLGKVVGDDNAHYDDVTITGARTTRDFISYENIDPSKVKRLKYVECPTFLYNPEPIDLDCHRNGFRIMESFWQELVPQLYKGGIDLGRDLAKRGRLSDNGTLDGSTHLYPSWDVVEWVYMPIHAEGDHSVTGGSVGSVSEDGRVVHGKVHGGAGFSHGRAGRPPKAS